MCTTYSLSPTAKFSKILARRFDDLGINKRSELGGFWHEIIVNTNIYISKNANDYFDAVFLKILGFFLCAFAARLLYAWCFPVPLLFSDTAKGFEIAIVLIAVSAGVQKHFDMRFVALLLRALCLFTIGAMGTGYMTAVTFYVGRNLPFMDPYLFAADQILRFHWLDYMRFIDAHTWLNVFLYYAYQSIGWQPTPLLVLLALKLDYKAIYAFLTVELIGMMTVSAVAILVPTLGVYQYLGLSPVDHPHIILDSAEKWTAPILWLRDATFKTSCYPTIGLITFPSFHAVSAILYMWGWWRIPVARYGGLLLNAAMLFATPLYGSHYLVDVIAGTLIAILLLCWISDRLAIAQGGFNLLRLLRKSRLQGCIPAMS